MKVFILWTTLSGSMAYISEKQYHIIRKNFRDGKPWWLCSPMHPLDRGQIASIVTSHPKILRTL